MAPQTIARLLTEWATLFVLVVGPGLVAGLLWSPFLGSDRLRSLFERLWPGGSPAVSYPLAMVGLSLPWVMTAGGAIVRGSPEELAMANALLDVVVGLSALYLVGLPLVAGFGLPRAGIDWDDTGYGPRTWALLVGGASWYVALLATPTLALSVGLALGGGP